MRSPPLHRRIDFGFVHRADGALDVQLGGDSKRYRFTVDLDGTGTPLRDALIEIWQADANGLYNSPSEMRGSADANFTGWGRCATSTCARMSTKGAKC